MPISITKYCCKYCYREYFSYEQALQCEGLPIPEFRFEEGQEIHFQDERQSFDRYVYSGESGIIIHRFLDLITQNGGNPVHICNYIVRCNYNECIVIDFGEELKSFAEQKYTTGFVQSFKAERQRLGFI